jgi:hypothetical protein
VLGDALVHYALVHYALIHYALVQYARGRGRDGEYNQGRKRPVNSQFSRARDKAEERSASARAKRARGEYVDGSRGYDGADGMWCDVVCGMMWYDVV